MNAPHAVIDSGRAPRIRHGVRSRKRLHPDARLYGAWREMRQRCGNPDNKDWHHYGGRGIRVCEAWDRSFPVFLADMDDFAAMNAVYARYIVDPPPARATVQVARLPRDVRIEIDAIAVIP